MSRATISVYRHADPADLHERLTTSGSFRRRFVVTDTIFSMDGTIAPLPALAAVARRHGAHLVVDEAHATGVLGPGGRGAAAAAGVIPDVHVATLGKGLGTFGAYATGSRALIDVLLHRARSFVFTTALPPAVAETSRAAVAIAFGAEGETLRAALASRMDELRAGLDGLGLLAPGAGHTPIFPILIGDPRRALAATAALLERGIFLQAIRPPTVPRGTSRLRMSLMATHTEDHIAAALAALSDLRREGLL